MSQVGTAIRVRKLDHEVKRFISEHDRPVIVNIACGLDARFLRTDSGKGIQVDLDLPDVMAVRREFFDVSGRNLQISTSMFNTDWMDELSASYKEYNFAFIMEGVLMYFDEAQVKKFFNDLVIRFPGAELHFDVVSKFIAHHSGLHDSLKEYKGKVIFRWGINNPRELESWNPALKFVGAENYMSQEIRRWGLSALLNLIPPIARGQRILRYDIERSK